MDDGMLLEAKTCCALPSLFIKEKNPHPHPQRLSALDAFIASQRALLARTHSDIDRLRELKGDVVRDPGAFFANVDERVRLLPHLAPKPTLISPQLDSPSFRLSDAGGAYNLAFRQPIEWGAFRGCGTSLAPLSLPSHPLILTPLSRPVPLAKALPPTALAPHPALPTPLPRQIGPPHPHRPRLRQVPSPSPTTRRRSLG